MTRLILPVEADRIDWRVIQNVELRQTIPVAERHDIKAFELPSKLTKALQPDKEVKGVNDLPPLDDREVATDRDLENERKNYVIDWWAEARKLSEEIGEDSLQRWLVEQGYEPYVSIMQGPLPVTNDKRGPSVPAEGDGIAYKNTYGESEIKINENCVMQGPTTVHDGSDFAQNLPARIICKSPPEKKLSFQQQDRK